MALPIDIENYISKNTKVVMGKILIQGVATSLDKVLDNINFEDIEAGHLEDPKGYYSFIHEKTAKKKSVIKQRIQKIIRSLKEEGNTPSPELEWSYEDFLKYVPIVDLGRKEVVRMYDRDLRLVDDGVMTYSAWRKLLPPDITNSIPCTPAVFTYNPLKLISSWKEVRNNIDLLHLNTYNPPEWRSKKIEKAECPELIKRFVIHLFPDKECRKYALNWVRNSILKERNGTYLILNAGKGVGKNLFVGICKSLVGENNFEMASTGFLESNFNSVLLDKRLICLDEFSIDSKSKMEKIKRYINASQNIERKGIDADKTQMTYNSFIICNNRGSDIKIEHDDRRFSPMEVTEKELSDIMNKEERNVIDQLGRLEEFSGETRESLEEMIAQFGVWLIQNCESKVWDEDSPWKGTRFYELVESSLWNWQRFLIDVFMRKEEVSYEYEMIKFEFENSSRHRDKFPNLHKVKDFLLCYKLDGKHIGYMEKIGGTNKYNIKVEERFHPQSENFCNEEDLVSNIL